jgi:hypothetical protein
VVRIAPPLFLLDLSMCCTNLLHCCLLDDRFRFFLLYLPTLFSLILFSSLVSTVHDSVVVSWFVPFLLNSSNCFDDLLQQYCFHAWKFLLLTPSHFTRFSVPLPFSLNFLSLVYYVSSPLDIPRLVTCSMLSYFEIWARNKFYDLYVGICSHSSFVLG